MESLWGDGRNPDPSRICTARRTNGEPCRKVAIRGAAVCATHGGSAPQVKQAARVRLEMAADRMAKELLKMVADDNAPYPVKLAAIKDALDRAGMSAKTAVEVEVNLKPWEKVFESISRDAGDDGAYERVLAMAEATEPELPDAVVIYELNTPDPGATPAQEPHAGDPDAHTAEPAGWAGVPGTPRALAAGASDAVTGDDAVARAAEHNRRGANLPVRYEDPAPHNPRGRK